MATTIASPQAGVKLERIGGNIIRYGLVLILLWIGGMKFTTYEAEGIRGLVSTSPLLSWTYQVMSVQMVSNLLGLTEIGLAALIATRAFWPKISAIGSIGAILMSLITLSFFFSAPRVWQQGYGFPVLGGTGQFLIKDLLLLGAATWTAGEALRAESRRDEFTHER
ncbi:MAG: YkgB family protein [Pyrinomonadaceae bacterium]